ncbi:MAG: magnesium transporter [Treponema sp.]|nr:magnesium transporter [Treponema sp.]
MSKKEEVLSAIANDHLGVSKLKALISDMNIADIAEIFEELDKEKSIQTFRILPKAIASDVFAYVESDRQQTIVEALTDAEIGEIMNTVFVDDAVDFIEEMPANVVRRVLKNVQGEKRKIINQILQYPDDSAGSIMTTEYVALREDATVQEAFNTIRNTGLNKETIYTCYVINNNRLLVGVITAKKLMLASPSDMVSGIMDANVVFAYTTDDQEAIADQFKKYDLLAMPVVDKEQMLVGIITVDDIMDVIVEEDTEDMEKMGALAPSDDPYMKTGIFRLAKNRFLWLLVLMLSATITANIIEGLRKALRSCPSLWHLFPCLWTPAAIPARSLRPLLSGAWR